MSAIIYDFKTGKVIDSGKPVEQEQERFSHEKIMETFGDVASALAAQGYEFEGALLIMPSGEEGQPPVTVSMVEGGSVQDMMDMTKAAYVNLSKARKLETEGDFTPDDAG